MIAPQHDGVSKLKSSTAMETVGVAGIWGAYWQSHSTNELLQTAALVLGIVGSILYIAVMIKKLMAPSNKMCEGD